jgi:membrane protease YdiL (CAAX protease family)
MLSQMEEHLKITGSGRRSIVVSAIICEGGLAAVAFMMGYLLQQPALSSSYATLPAFGQGLLATVPLVLGLLAIDWLPSKSLKQLDTFVRQSLVPLFRGLSLGEIFVIAALAGIGEEMLFRGVAQAWMAHVTDSSLIGLILASITFGLAHPLSRTYMVLAAAIGLYLGGLLLWTENLFVPIVTHAAYDLFAIAYLLHTTRKD